MPLYAVVSDTAVLSTSTRRTLHAAHDAVLRVGLTQQAARIVDFLATSTGLVGVIRALSVVEAHASAAAEDTDDVGERVRWQRAADMCGSAIRRVLADYERAVRA